MIGPTTVSGSSGHLHCSNNSVGVDSSVVSSVVFSSQDRASVADLSSSGQLEPKSSGYNLGFQESKVVVHICRGLSLLVPLKCGKLSTTAVVDTAAQATLVSREFYSLVSQIGPAGIPGEQVLIKGLGEQPVQAEKVVGWKFQLGSSTYQWDVLVTPMADHVILGLDFFGAFWLRSGHAEEHCLFAR